MRLDITVSLEKYAAGLLGVQLRGSGIAGRRYFKLAALTPGTGITAPRWRLSCGQPQGEDFSVDGPDFALEYELAVPHKVCLGSDKRADLLYPFMNDGEVFFGTGCLPVTEEDCEVSLRLAGLPPGWSEFSSLAPGGMSAEKLRGFFCYCSGGQAPAEHVFRGAAQETKLRVLAQRGKELPMGAGELFSFFDGYMGWLEGSLAPYRRAPEINYLVLQAPPDFEALAGSRSFATGENVLNGVACYAPPGDGYIRERFGYRSYAHFLYEGLAHELTHFYTSGVCGVPSKTVLYPAPDCPGYASRLIAEALNLYFCTQYVSEHVPEGRGSFDAWIERCRGRLSATGARQPLLDLLELDSWLQGRGSGLLALFREMVLLRLDDRRPYASAAFLFDTLRSRLGVEPPAALEAQILAQP